MNFRHNEIIGHDCGTWAKVSEEIRFLDRLPANPNRKSQWIFRAVGKWEEPHDRSKSDKAAEAGYSVSLYSSLDDAFNRRIGQLDARDRRLYESWMLYEFKREAQNYVRNLPPSDDFLEWLALGRHYSLPSRLVDFTYSFYIAAYFAIAKLKSGEDGQIIALNLSWMKDEWEKKLRTEYGQKFRGRKGSFHDKDLFQQFAFHRHEKYAVVVNTLRRNPRLARQHGCFVCPGNVEVSFDDNLAATVGDQPNVKKLVRLPSRVRTEAMRDLMQMNVTLATLYPDLTGWAESRRDLVHLDDIADERFRRELEIAIRQPRI